MMTFPLRELDLESREAGYRAGLVGELIAAPAKADPFSWYFGHAEGEAEAVCIHAKLIRLAHHSGKERGLPSAITASGQTAMAEKRTAPSGAPIVIPAEIAHRLNGYLAVVMATLEQLQQLSLDDRSRRRLERADQATGARSSATAALGNAGAPVA